MPMIKNFLKESVSIIVGKPAEEIVEVIYSPKHINEFLLSKKLNLTINQTRNILYKLSDYGIVSSVRKKDKRKGWYTYFWRIEPLKSLEFFKNSLAKKIEQLNYQIKSKETKSFYICERCNVELNEETALLNSFTCNECGGLFSLKDNLKTIKDLQKNLEKLKEELSLVEIELNKEKEKVEKTKVRESKKQKALKELSRKKRKGKVKKVKKIKKKLRPSLAKVKKKGKPKKVKTKKEKVKKTKGKIKKFKIKRTKVKKIKKKTKFKKAKSRKTKIKK